MTKYCIVILRDYKIEITKIIGPFESNEKAIEYTDNHLTELILNGFTYLIEEIIEPECNK